MPAGRYELVALPYRGQVHLLGGRGPDGLLSRIGVLDVEDGRWRAATTRMRPRYFLCGAVLAGRLFAVGGEGPAGSGIVEAFDPRAGRWERLPDLRTPRTHADAVSCGGRLFVIGGHARGKGDLAEVEVWEPGSDGWAPGPALPEPAHGQAAAVLGGRVHLVGGSADGTLHLVLQDGGWRRRAPLPRERIFAEAEAVAGRLVVVGGGPGFRSVFVYDPERDVWETGPRAPRPLYHFATAAVGNLVFCFGGVNLPAGDGLRISDAVEVLDAGRLVWSTGRPAG